MFLFFLIIPVVIHQAMFRLGESDYTLIKQQQQHAAAQDQTHASDTHDTTTTNNNNNNNSNSISKEDREAALSLFRKAKLWGIHVPLPADQLENLQRDVQGKGPGLTGKGQGLGGVSTAVHEVRVCLPVSYPISVFYFTLLLIRSLVKSLKCYLNSLPF